MLETDRFLAALDKPRATFQTFADAPGANGKPIILHGPHRVRREELQALNYAGHGIFVMVNDGDLQGRRAENVKSIAAYFVDLDGSPLPTELPIEPTVTVESSPGRFHLYWRVTDAPLETFPHVQKHLALLLGGDSAVHDLPRVMRLPGYSHRKREPFETRILATTENVVSHADFLDAFAVPEAPPPRRPLPPAAQAYIDHHKRGGKPAPRRDLDTAVERIATAREGTRNVTLFRIASAIANDVKAGKISRTEAEHQLELAAVTAGLDDHEVQATIRSAMRFAS